MPADPRGQTLVCFAAFPSTKPRNMTGKAETHITAPSSFKVCLGCVPLLEIRDTKRRLSALAPHLQHCRRAECHVAGEWNTVLLLLLPESRVSPSVSSQDQHFLVILRSRGDDCLLIIFKVSGEEDRGSQSVRPGGLRTKLPGADQETSLWQESHLWG